MRSLHSWIKEYRESHTHPLNQKIHFVCVPLITLATIGLLAAIPVPAAFEKVAYLNWATIVAGACLLYYFALSTFDAFGMAIAVLIDFALVGELTKMNLLLPVAGTIFAVAWIVQIYGHKVEGKSPSFLSNAVFFLIGPVWVNRKIFSALSGRKLAT